MNLTRDSKENGVYQQSQTSTSLKVVRGGIKEIEKRSKNVRILGSLSRLDVWREYESERAQVEWIRSV